MRTTVVLSLLLLSAMSDATIAAEAPAVAKALKQKTAPCLRGELGGVVASNVKAKNGDYVTRYKGDKTPFNTPLNAGDEYIKVSKLKAGDVNCIQDDGS